MLGGQNIGVRRRLVAVSASLLTIAGMLMAPEPSALAAPSTVVVNPVDAVAASAPQSATATATARDGFRAGNIISDEVFFAKDTMTEAQIQTFLEARVRSCASGATCLRDFRQTTRTEPANNYCREYVGAQNERASRIIYKVAQACGINPQVILVTLQKEQGLVTSRAPSGTMYQIAMGYGCPDTAPCDARYYGFFNQVYRAAWQFQSYTNWSGWSRYEPGTWTDIAFNPAARCGSSRVFIENQATANLYYYTPFQPNAAALAAGYGTGDTCSAYGNRNFYNYFTDWFGSTGSVQVDPVGAVTSWTPIAGGVRIEGWAVDPDTDAVVSLRVMSAGVVVARANASRPNGGALERFPLHGANRGFSVDVRLPAGEHQLCVAANNVNRGANRTIGCSAVTAAGGDPFGAVTTWTPYAGGVRVTGWAIDPDTRGGVSLRIKSGETVVARVTANRDDATIAARYPAFGAAHGFSADVPLAPGTQTVCIAANNVGVGVHRTLGCRDVTPLGGSPFGAAEEIVAVPGGVRISGWAIDPDTTAPVTVRIKSGDEVLQRVLANGLRDDIGQRYVAFGAQRGFSTEVPLPPGTHEICVAVNNTGVGSSRTLDCKSITPPSGAPFGYINSFTPIPGGVRVSGWIIDPDVTAPVTFRIKSGETLVARGTASAVRRDIAARFPDYGGGHGFSVDVPLQMTGQQQICVAANNVGAGRNATIGCRNVTPLTGSPIGAVESWTQTPDGLGIEGWSIDPDTTAPVVLRVKVGDSTVTRVTANLPREDIARTHPLYGADHGFSVVVPIPAGETTVCVATNNVGGGRNSTLECRAVTT